MMALIKIESKHLVFAAVRWWYYGQGIPIENVEDIAGLAASPAVITDRNGRAQGKVGRA
jgi:hypothetical protein